MLAGNQLQVLPQELAACTQLELLRIAANRFEALPDFLLSMPRLSWLAYAGNPFCDDNEIAAVSHAPIAPVAWKQLQMQQKLGEGASGVIHQALLTGGKEDSSAVAVKLFKGELTSDGLPHSEMAACICAGKHPNLIGVQGKIDGHPKGEQGLVMALVDERFCNLAGPPSLSSCTRDEYATDSRFTLHAAIRIAFGIAAAMRHLHSQGINHGDLYAHNILHSDEGHALLGDFGAASFFSPEDVRCAMALQRIEVRAFACLLEELLQRCVVPEDGEYAFNALADLQRACAQNDNEARPLFAEICGVLEQLAK
jgi:hypothetical protein